MIRGQKLVYTTFIALLISAFVCTQSATVIAADGIAANAATIDPAETGEMAPAD